MKVLDLFSGVGGFSLGLERAGMETVAFCEIEPYCQKVLAKHWPDVPIYDDVREVTCERLKADGLDRIDVISGGYPCQPFSVAGARRGKEDDRHLWPELLRIIQEVRPRFVVCENVIGHIDMGLDEVLIDLGTEGYTTVPFVIPAAGINAVHRRGRVWILAHADPVWKLQQERCERNQRGWSGDGTEKGIHPDPDSQGLQGGQERGGNEIFRAKSVDEYTGGRSAIFDGIRYLGNPVEPPFCGGNDGIPCGMDRAKRIKALGNAVVPQIPEIIGRAIMECCNSE